MRRRIVAICLSLFLASFLAACDNAINTELAQSAETPTKAATSKPANTETITLTYPVMQSPEPTFGKEDAQKEVQKLMADGLSCSSPCFWGIIPGKTTMEESKSIFSHLGFPLSNCEHNCSFDSMDRLDPKIYAQMIAPQETIESISLILVPTQGMTADTPDRPGYLPDRLIQSYGAPSEVRIGVGLGPGPDNLFIQIFFSEKDFVIGYKSGLDITMEGKSTLCPGNITYNSIRIWIGKDPANPPKRIGKSLEEVTDLSLAEFTALMQGNPIDACFSVDSIALIEQ